MRELRRFVRSHLGPVLAVLLAAAIAIAATVDHHVKQDRRNDAEESAWFCAHRGTRCGGPSSAGIEASWQTRQIVYEAAIGALAVLAVGGVLYRRLPNGG